MKIAEAEEFLWRGGGTLSQRLRGETEIGLARQRVEGHGSNYNLSRGPIMFACRLFSSKKTMLWSVLGSIVACAAVPTNGFAIDKIATNAKAVFTKAGGTTKEGLTKEQFHAAEAKISDAINRMARDGIIGGAVAPPVAIKRDLSKKDKITYLEFLDYFRGIASEQDLKIRRALVDQAVAEQAAAQAAAGTAIAAAQQAAADAEAARREAQAERERDGAESEQARLDREDRELQLIRLELMWYLEHPKQPWHRPNSTPSNVPPSGQLGVAASGAGGAGAGAGSGNPKPGKPGIASSPGPSGVPPIVRPSPAPGSGSSRSGNPASGGSANGGDSSKGKSDDRKKQ
jgi:hypothetical protein